MQLEYIMKEFMYSEDSPSGLVWKVVCYRGNEKNRYVYRDIGDTAGSLNPNGYWYLGLRRKEMKLSELAHRVVYALHYGIIPDNMAVDHIDGNPLNNRIDNLRLVTRRQNKRNSKKYMTNTSGKTGVHFEEGFGGKSGHGRYRAMWVDAQGNNVSKSYSVSVYGHGEAKALAERARDAGITETGDYTQRHGY